MFLFKLEGKLAEKFTACSFYNLLIIHFDRVSLPANVILFRLFLWICLECAMQYLHMDMFVCCMPNCNISVYANSWRERLYHSLNMMHGAIQNMCIKIVKPSTYSHTYLYIAHFDHKVYWKLPITVIDWYCEVEILPFKMWS